MFEPTGLHCLAVPGYATVTRPQSTTFASMHNVIIEVKASFAQSHIYGPQQLDKSLYYLVVRGANASGYSASYTPDGHYELHADASDASNILGQGTVSNFQIGDGFLNTIALVVQDTTVSLYVKLPAGDASDRSDH